jgi:hypothetical protein
MTLRPPVHEPSVAEESRTATLLGTVGACWGLAGVGLILGAAIYRLAAVAGEALTGPLEWQHWAICAGVVAFMAYAEGYRGFQQRFSPRCAARARHLRAHARALHVLLAPFFCMGYFHATRRRQIASLSLTAGIVGIVLAVRLLSQPWRGIIDAGVVVGLAWGLLSLLIFGVRALTARELPYTPEFPEPGIRPPTSPPASPPPTGTASPS